MALRSWLASFVGVVLGLFALVQIARAEPNTAGACLARPTMAPRDTQPVLPLTYVQAITTSAISVYSQPTDAAAGVAPIATFAAGFVWFSLADTQPLCQEGQWWYKVNPDGYISAANATSFQPSQFRGLMLSGILDAPLAWIVYPVRPSSVPGKAPSSNTARLPQYTPVNISDELQVGNWRWYRVGDNQWVEERNLGLVKPSPRPAGIGANEKWIEVNLYEQTLAAYEGDRIVYVTLVSTGLPWWPTPTGLFRTWFKQQDGKMSGREGFEDYYYLENVPWIMYFDGSVALHGAYWHDQFGAPHSHGCVNLSPLDAQWLFNWTTPTAAPNSSVAKPDDPGTWVWVHN